MIISIDVSPLYSRHMLLNRVRGVGFYIQNLVASLKKYVPQEEYITFKHKSEIPEKTSVLHIPYFEPFFLTLPLIKKFKTVITVHDLTPLVFSQFFPPGIKGSLKWQIQKKLLHSADAIIADSDCSKKDIISITGIKEEKIHAVYLAADEDFAKKNFPDTEKKKIFKKYGIPQNFVLYVGDATWNKNLPRLVEACIRSKTNLVMVGKALATKVDDKKNSWNKDLVVIQALVKDLKNVYIIGFVEKEDLIALYNMATLFILPSIYEGFGLPLLEAMSCGCPSIAADSGSLPEIGGDGVFYVDPYDINNIAKGIEKVSSDKNYRKILSEKGMMQAKKFSWKKAAIETAEVYKSVLQK